MARETFGKGKFRLPKEARVRAAIIVVVLFLLLGTSTATAGLVVNGGFETGDFSGWTLTGATTGYYGITNVIPHSGTYAAWFGDPFNLTFISQNIATVPGQLYEASFWGANHNGTGPTQNEIQVFLNGDEVVDATNVGNFPWTFEETTFTATQSSTEIEFGFYNVPGWFNLDDVGVEAVPEPGSMVLCGVAFALLMMCGKPAFRL